MASIRRSLQALMLDMIFGVYLAVTMHRIMWHHVVFNTEPDDLTFPIMAVYAVAGIVVGAVLSGLKASPGRKIFGLTEQGTWRNTLAVHVLWILAIVTVITSWIVTQ